MMTGRDLEVRHDSQNREIGNPILQVEFGAGGEAGTVTVGAGEVLGMAGLLGSGLTEFLKRVYGAEKAKPVLNLKNHAIRVAWHLQVADVARVDL